MADLLRAKQGEGVIALHEEPEAVATLLFVLADGVAMRMLIDPTGEHAATLRAGIVCARALLADHV